MDIFWSVILRFFDLFKKRDLNINIHWEPVILRTIQTLVSSISEVRNCNSESWIFSISFENVYVSSSAFPLCNWLRLYQQSHLLQWIRFLFIHVLFRFEIPKLALDIWCDMSQSIWLKSDLSSRAFSIWNWAWQQPWLPHMWQHPWIPHMLQSIYS